MKTKLLIPLVILLVAVLLVLHKILPSPVRERIRDWTRPSQNDGRDRWSNGGGFDGGGSGGGGGSSTRF